MKIEKYIYELLYKYDCVIVANLGGFILNTKPASFDDEKSVFYPPKKEIAFNSLLTSDDGVLISYIAYKEHISYQDAKKNLYDFVHSIKNKFNVYEPVFLDKLGLLYVNDDDSILFSAAVEVNFNSNCFGLSNFIMPKITKSKNKRSINVFEYAASIIAILCIGFVFYTAADFGFKNIYYASLFPNNTQKLKGNNLTESIYISSEANDIVRDDNTACNDSAPEIVTMEESSNHYSVISPKEIIIATSEINIDSEFILTNSGKKHPFVIIASCADYEGAKTITSQIRQKGYENAAIIHSDKRFRVTIDAFMEHDSLNFVLNNARENIVEAAWVLYY